MSPSRPEEAPHGRLAREQEARFEAVYARDRDAYGAQASPELASFVEQCVPGGWALDLGAGPGRDSLALARRGLHVTAIDLAEAGIEALRESACKEGLSGLIDARAGDVRRVDFAPEAYDVIVAATVLDHMPLEDARRILEDASRALTATGVLYVEVHTTEDPGSPVGSGSRKEAPVSETAGAIVHYFRPNELLSVLAGSFRVLFYEERLEWDTTHGRPHEHGKALALCVRPRAHPPYFGQEARGLRRR
jgi:cyclopropane fatty-acyl-phospholipid synthase-like methyltransferase